MLLRIPLTRIIVTCAMLLGGMGLLGLGIHGAGAQQSTCSGERSDIDEREEDMLDLINAFRAENGVGPLSLSPRLNALAAWKSEDDSAGWSYLSHTDSLGRSARDRAVECGYGSGVGENASFGYRSAQAAFDAFMQSPGHRANMRDGRWRAAGIGASGPAWTLMFGTTDDGGGAPTRPAATSTPTPTATSTPTATPTPTPEPAPEYEVEFSKGLNLVTWPEPDVPADRVFADADGFVRAVYAWDSNGQEWRRFIPGAPQYVNSLVTMQRGNAYFVDVTRTDSVAY